MKKIAQLVRWGFQAWPVWEILVFIAISMGAIFFFEIDKATVHKMGIFLQSAGVVVVLYSLNKNMGVFKQASLYQRAFRWIKAFPLIKRDLKINVAGGIQVQSSVGNVTLQQWNKDWTPEQKIEELKSRIATCFEDASRSDQEIREKIESVKMELSSEVQKSNKSIAEVRSKLESATIGSVNPQFFGVLLAIYGTVLLI